MQDWKKTSNATIENSHKTVCGRNKCRTQETIKVSKLVMLQKATYSESRFLFYAPEIEYRGAYYFCPVCHFLWNLNLLITFEQWELELWYFKWIFTVIKPFHGYLYWSCDLELGVWPIFENFNLAYNFWTVSARAFKYSLW